MDTDEHGFCRTNQQIKTMKEAKTSESQVTTLDQVRAVTKPPPSKKMILEATAQLLFNANQKARDEAGKKITAVVERRDAALRKYCKPLLKTAAMEYCGYSKKMAFNVPIPDELVRPFSEEIKSISMPQFKSVKDYLVELREAAVVPGEAAVTAMLSDKVICEKLLQLGRTMLAIPAAKGAISIS
jgi:hypothetical protein